MRLNKEMRVLLVKNNLKAFHFVFTRLIILFLLLLIIFSSEIVLPLKILSIVSYYVIFSFLGMAGISHELLHNTLFKKSVWNKIFFRTYSILSLSNYSFYEFTHWEHHKSPLLENDPKDLFKGRLSLKNFILWITFDVVSLKNRFRILFLNAIGIIPNKKIYSQILTQPDGIHIVRRIRRAAQFILFTHALICIFVIWINKPEMVFFITLAPFILTFFNKILAIAQHYGLEYNEDLFYSCRTAVLPNWLSYLYGNMNYHTEHHLFPGIPAYNLPLAHKHLYSSKDVEFHNLSIGFIGLLKDLKTHGLFSKSV